MPILLGENVNLGVGVESVRGTPVVPQAFIPGRTPTGVRPIVEKVLLKETRKSRAGSYGEEIVQVRAEGDHEFNMRSKSIGYILKSLIGTPVDGAVGGGVYSHAYEPDIDDPQQPTLSLYVSQEGQQDYTYPNAVVKSLEIKTPVNDLVQCKASFLATKETEIGSGDETAVTHDDADLLFRPYDVSIKKAVNVAGLGAATALPIKEFGITINNNARFDTNLGSLNPADVLGLMFEVNGSFKVDHEDETYHDLFTAGTEFALEISIARDASTKLVITLPKCTANWSPERPIDDVVRDGVDFIAHYDSDAGKQFSAVLTNNVADYNAA